MGEQEISQTVRSFIADHIDSVLQLEVLLLLHAHAQRDWTAGQVGRELRVDEAWAAGQLDDLCKRGMLSCVAEPAPRYQYQPASGETREAVAALAERYATHRVTIIGMIYAKPADKLRSFADAFRLRKDKPHG